MQVNDVVAVLYGCIWPVVLRPMAEAGHFEAVDIAYVHGIMFGEAVRERQLLRWDDEVLILH